MTQRKTGLNFRRISSRIDAYQPGGPQLADSVLTRIFEFDAVTTITSALLWEWNGTDTSQFETQAQISFSESATIPTIGGLNFSVVPLSSAVPIDDDRFAGNWIHLHTASLLRVSGAAGSGGTFFEINDVNLSGVTDYVVEIELFSASSGFAQLCVGLFYEIFTGSVHGAFYTVTDQGEPNLLILDRNQARDSQEAFAPAGAGFLSNDQAGNRITYRNIVEVIQRPNEELSPGADLNKMWSVNNVVQSNTIFGSEGVSENQVTSPIGWNSGSLNKMGIGVYNNLSAAGTEFYIKSIRVVKHWRDI